jgi:hypothetical protein
MFEADLADVFFGPDFSTSFTRERSSADDVAVAGIFGAADADALDGRVVATARMLHLPATADVDVDDVLVAMQAIEGLLAIGDRFRVLDHPERVNDGREKRALLGSVSE